MHKKLGKIDSVYFGLEDHGILTFWFQFKFDGSGQGFGGIGLDEWDKEKDRRVGTAAGCDLILRLLDVFGVSDLNKIGGKHAYALYADKQWNSTIIGVQRTEPEGGKIFLIDDWRKEWGFA